MSSSGFSSILSIYIIVYKNKDHHPSDFVSQEEVYQVCSQVSFIKSNKIRVKKKNCAKAFIVVVPLQNFFNKCVVKLKMLSAVKV